MWAAQVPTIAPLTRKIVATAQRARETAAGESGMIRFLMGGSGQKKRPLPSSGGEINSLLRPRPVGS
jgi:hypothetical protein